jgi:hypothetical protein
MQANHKHYTLILISIIALASSFSGYFIFFKRILYQSNQGGKASSVVALNNEKKSLEKEMESIYKSTVEDRAFVTKIILPQDEIVGFIEKVENISNDTKAEVSISSITNTMNANSKVGDMGYMTAHIEAKGLWSNVMRTLSLVENMPYSITINNIRLEGEKDASMDKKKTQPMWNLSLDIKVLIVK